jgi:hypothetical protein
MRSVGIPLNVVMHSQNIRAMKFTQGCFLCVQELELRLQIWMKIMQSS